MTLNRRLVQGDHVHAFVISQSRTGWDIREEEDARVMREVHHDDWHRVERDAFLFDLRAIELKRDGWIEH